MAGMRWEIESFCSQTIKYAKEKIQSIESTH